MFIVGKAEVFLSIDVDHTQRADVSKRLHRSAPHSECEETNKEHEAKDVRLMK